MPSLFRRSVLCLLLALPTAASAQFRDRLFFQGGFSFDFLPIETPFGQNVFDFTPRYYSIHLGANYLLAQSNDWLSLSTELSMNIDPFAVLSSGPVEFYFKPGLYLVGRIGGAATRYNEQRIGGGLGVGFSYAYIQIPYEAQVPGPPPRIVRSELAQWIPAPTVIAELTLNLPSGTYTLRGHLNLGAYDGNFEDNFGFAPSYESFGVGLIFRLN